MNRKLLVRKTITLSVTVAMVVTYSLVTLANTGKGVGELIVMGNDSDTQFVTVNGEAAKSGRTVFSSSTITTPEGFGAVVNLGKAGKIELAPNSTFALSFDETAINGELASGSVTVLTAPHSVGVRTLTGDLVQLNAGEAASATSGAPSKPPAPATPGPLGLNWGIWAAIIGGAIVTIVVLTNRNGTSTSTTTIVSPTR